MFASPGGTRPCAQHGYVRDMISVSRHPHLGLKMARKLPLSDFRSVRHKLESHEFAISEGQDIEPTDLVDEDTWTSITHLPDDVAIRTSDHNGVRFALLHSLWSDWITSTGDPDNPD